MAVLLLMPFTAYPDMDFFAPAWFVSLFEGLTKATEQGALRAGVPLLVAEIVALVVYITVATVLIIRKRKAGTASKQASPPDVDTDSESNAQALNTASGS